MARQVYLDPFGSYVGGYDKGVQTEQNLQANVRNARDSDYKYNVLNPLELNKLQRDDEVGAVAQPYRLQLPMYGFENARAETFKNMLGAGESMAQYGYIGPTLRAMSVYTGDPYRVDPYTQTGGFIDPVGNYVGPQQNQGSVLQGQPGIRLENRGVIGENFNRGIAAGGLGVQQQNANTAQAQAAANSLIGFGNNYLKSQEQAAAEANDPLFFWNHGSPWTQHVFQGGPAPGSGGTPAGGPAPTQQAMPPPQASTGRMPAYLLPNPPQPQLQAPLPQQYNPPAPQQIAAPQVAPLTPPAAAPPVATPPAGPISTVDQLVQRMRATNPAAPAVTAAELMAMDPTTQEQYMVQYYPALLQELKAQKPQQTAAPTNAVIQ